MRSFFISTIVALIISQCVTALVAPTPEKGKLLIRRQFIDYGPTPAVNCTQDPSRCPNQGPSGTLNSPVNNDTLTTIWDNSGYVDVSYTPVKKDIPEGSVRTSSVIFTLRQYFFGVPVYADTFIYLGALSVPANSDFSAALKFRLALPARRYDGDNDPQNDVGLGNQGGGNFGTYGFQVIEQQVFRPLNVSDGQPSSYLIQFQSAGPLVNITYIPNHFSD